MVRPRQLAQLPPQEAGRRLPRPEQPIHDTRATRRFQNRQKLSELGYAERWRRLELAERQRTPLLP